jgi:hypothetical protein
MFDRVQLLFCVRTKVYTLEWKEDSKPHFDPAVPAHLLADSLSRKERITESRLSYMPPAVSLKAFSNLVSRS